jgi:hypothetical protein
MAPLRRRFTGVSVDSPGRQRDRSAIGEGWLQSTAVVAVLGGSMVRNGTHIKQKLRQEELPTPPLSPGERTLAPFTPQKIFAPGPPGPTRGRPAGAGRSRPLLGHALSDGVPGLIETPTARFANLRLDTGPRLHYAEYGNPTASPSCSFTDGPTRGSRSAGSCRCCRRAFVPSPSTSVGSATQIVRNPAMRSLN